MRKVGLGETNLGAVAAAVVAGIGGLFAIGIVPAVVDRNMILIFQIPSLNLISCVLSTVSAWLFGGQLGPRVGEPLRSQRMEAVTGGCCGLVVVLIVAAVGWYLNGAFSDPGISSQLWRPSIGSILG
jgi:hypothetical protein